MPSGLADGVSAVWLASRNGRHRQHVKLRVTQRRSGITPRVTARKGPASSISRGRAISVPLTPVGSGTPRSIADSSQRRPESLLQVDTAICKQGVTSLRGAARNYSNVSRTAAGQHDHRHPQLTGMTAKCPAVPLVRGEEARSRRAATRAATLSHSIGRRHIERSRTARPGRRAGRTRTASTTAEPVF